MVKQLSIIFTSILMVLAVVGCGQTESSNNSQDYTSTPIASAIPDILIFVTLEELLYAHREVREGNATSELAQMAARFNFASLEELPLMTNPPEGYHLHGIFVSRGGVIIQYFPEEALISEEARRIMSGNLRGFNLGINFWDSDTPISGVMRQNNALEEDLIDGKYLFGERTGTLFWAHGRSMLSLSLPSPDPTRNFHSISALSEAIAGFEGSTIYDLLILTETIIIDLTDEALITYLIGDLHQISFNLCNIPPHRLPSDPVLTTQAPVGAGIFNFLEMHERFPIDDHNRRDTGFLGWYLDVNFTEPLSRVISFMPAHDITLYARWQ